MDASTSLSTSSSLIRQVQANQPAAWIRLSQLYTPMAFGWCKRAGLQQADIADVLQEVFTAVHRGIATFRRPEDGGTFRGWLWTITRNALRRHFRRKAGQPLAAGGSTAQRAMQNLPELLASESPPADATAEQHFVRRALTLIEAEFEVKTWTAFWRTAVDGRSAADVGEELGMNAGAVRQAKSRVLLRLRAFLSDP